MGLTIKDIAERSGVSTATVSRVLNKSKPVSPQLRRKVLKVIEETGYEPNALARGLVKRETGLIGVIVPEIGEIEYAEILEGIEEEAREKGFNIIPVCSQGLPENELEILKQFRGRQLEGVIFSGTVFTGRHRQFFQEFQLPVVTVNQNLSQYSLPSVTVNNFQVAYEAAEYLIRLGHRRIAFISRTRESISGKNSCRGLKAALQEHGLEINEEYIKEGGFSLQGGHEKMEEILGKRALPTAVLASSDKLAVGAMNCCLEAGYPVPEDISMIGFGDEEIASAVRPALTTFYKDNREMGATAARLLIRRVRGEDGGLWNLFLPCRLIVRESTGRCKP